MRKMRLLTILVLSAITTLVMVQCNDDEDPVFDAPTVTPPSDSDAMPGESVSLDFTISAPGKVATVTVTASSGTATIDDATTIVGQTSGTVSVTYIAPAEDGAQTVTLTVTDQQATAKSSNGIANVTVASLEGPTVTPPSDSDAIVGDSTTLDFTISAPGKVASVSVAASAGTATIVDATTIVGETSGTVSVTYTAPLSDGAQTVTLTVADQQTTAKSSNGIANVTVDFKPESSSELLVTKFKTAPTLDGEIDDMWATAAKLVSKTAVPSNLGPRNTYYNEDGIGEEILDIFEAYEGEEQNFTMRSGYADDDIYFLIEWDDADDSKDRQSWYFDDSDKKWKGQHKYANDATDKFYEDKFAFLFPIGTVDGFSTTTCYATCHSSGGTITTAKDKHTRHYTTTPGQKIDMWHWKRVRGTYADQVDDQRIYYVDDTGAQGKSGSNGRGGDAGGTAGYSNNQIKLPITGTTDSVNVPMYVIPDQTDYYWIAFDDDSKKEVTAVDANGVLTYSGGTIDPADGGYEEGTGEKRFPSIITKAFEGPRADIDVKYKYTGTGWICEVKRKLNTGDPDDAVFDPVSELPFGFATFNNAAIAHAIKPGLLMKFEQ